MLADFLEEVAIVSKLHDDSETLALLIDESFFVRNYKVILNAGKYSNFIEGILLLLV
jgi:hypothetical protein